MSKDDIFISVVIPTYNGLKTLYRCINCLLSQNVSDNYEVIISDDGSTDGTSQLLTAYKDERVRYLQHENYGRAQNRNIGARRARGHILVFLDADMLPMPGFLSAHRQALEQAGERGVISGAVPVAKECEAYPVGRFLARKWERRLAALQREPDNVFHMQGGNFCISKGFFEELGGFDVRFRRYGGEDTDLFARAYLAGARFQYSPEALAYQLVDVRFADLLAKASNAHKASNLVLQRYPMLISRAAVSQPVKLSAAKLSPKGRAWQLFRRAPFSSGLLLRLLPLAERCCSDKAVFLLYNSLLSERRRRSGL